MIGLNILARSSMRLSIRQSSCHSRIVWRLLIALSQVCLDVVSRPQLGLTYRTAWLLAQKLRRSMVDPDRGPLEGVVEVDQTEIPFREGDGFFEPGNGGKILVIGAVEVIDRDTHQSKPRRKPHAGHHAARDPRAPDPKLRR